MTDIFISYSHSDEAWKNRLQAPLRALQLHNDFKMWDDRQIELGATWLPAIEKAIAQAKVAVLLVSNDFLASEFVTRQEIPKFLQRREQEGLRVVPLVVRPCPWQGVEWLAALQGATPDNKSLVSLRDEHEIEAALSEVALRIYRLLQDAKREEALRVAEAELLERERLAREAEAQHLAEEKAQRAAAAKREADLKRQAEINAQERDARQQAINQQRIVTLSDKLSKFYLQRDTETRVEEKFRLDTLIQETESELAGLGVSTSSTSTVEKPQVFKVDVGGLNKWILSSVGVAVMAGAGWVFVDINKPAPSVPAAIAAPVPVADKPSEPIKPERLTFEPEMVDIPAGTFTMGCVPKRDLVEGMDKCPDDELPAREVKVDTFKMGKYEVTFDEWDACEQAEVCPHAEDNGWGRGKRPVINVSWDDVQVYLEWLNKRTGKNYRLPSETEWEYAARAQPDSKHLGTAYSWGSSIGKNKANCDSSCGDSYEYTAPVGSFTANSYGLYDIHGNVWEWVADCYASTTVHSMAIDIANCSRRVLRGGSWYRDPQLLRSAGRSSFLPSSRFSRVGFRVAVG